MRAYQERTGERYDPPAALRACARALAQDESCPTLFRYPGPLGLYRALAGLTVTLAPAEQPWIYLADHPLKTAAAAVRHFGALVILDGLRLAPCATDQAGVYLGVNRRVALGSDVLWTPPDVCRQERNWDEVVTIEQARALVGDAEAQQRTRVVASLQVYLEELALLAAARTAEDGRAWHEIDRVERRRLLAAIGQPQRWTE
ncbi:MAG: hypothetical protein MUF51_05450 [Vicinamibacteria bacterium]|nr:hypothetical protein [Vicinamibacteria bacterium]